MVAVPVVRCACSSTRTTEWHFLEIFWKTMAHSFGLIVRTPFVELLIEFGPPYILFGYNQNTSTLALVLGWFGIAISGTGNLHGCMCQHAPTDAVIRHKQVLNG